MNSNKTVEVICLNGRKQKVKVSSTSTILKVLKDVCQKHGYNDREVDLVHKRKVLDVSSTVAHANIPNNGKLEMTKRNIPRKATQVEVALQTEFSGRLQQSFDPACSLYDILKYWDKDTSSPCQGKIIHKTPVVIYLQRQISGIQALKLTTLENLGLISGKAAIRLIHKDEDDVDLSIEASSSVSALPRDTEECKGSEDEPTTATNLMEPDDTTSVKEPQEKKQKLGDNKESIEDFSEKVIPTEQPSATSTRSITTQPVSDFKFPERGAEQSNLLTEVNAINPKEILAEVKLSMPCARNAVVFHFEKIQKSFSEPEEPSDEFFDVTVDELRKMMLEKSQNMYDGPLLTKAMREAKEKEKMLKYKKVIVRIIFPDKLALQGVFRPLEEVNAVKEFVRQNLADDKTSFQLYTTPPKSILKNLKQTLYEAKLVPSAIIRVLGEPKSERWLKQEFIDKAVTYEEAETSATNFLQSCVPSSSSNTQTTSSIESPPGKTEEASTSSPTTTEDVSSGASATRKPKTEGKLPKWFMQGKK